MNKITSWDGLAFNGYVYPADTKYSTALKEGTPCRVKVWPEGAPDRSEVPHAGDDFTFDGHRTKTVRHGIPEQSGKSCGSWCIRATDGKLYSLSRIGRIPDAPTVKIGEKTYNLADAVARCEPLEEV